MTRLFDRAKRLRVEICGLMRAETDLRTEIEIVKQMIQVAEAELKAVEEKQVAQLVKQEDRQ